MNSDLAGVLRVLDDAIVEFRERDLPVRLHEATAARATIAALAERTEQPVATVCMTPEYWGHGEMVSVELQVMPGTKLERGLKLYTHPSDLVPALKALERRQLFSHLTWVRADELDRILAAHEGQQNTQEGGK